MNRADYQAKRRKSIKEFDELVLNIVESEEECNFDSKEYSSRTSFYGCTSDNNFVQIDHIILRAQSISCLCTTLDKCDLSHDVSLPPDVKRIVKKHCTTYEVQCGTKSMIPAESLSLSVVVVEFCNSCT